MGLEHFSINIEKPLYFPGETVIGSVCIVNNQLKNIKGIVLSYRGYAYVYFTKSESKSETDSDGNSRTVTESKSYSTTESYFNHAIPFVSVGNSVLPPGEHVFNFEFQLPLNIPSSYEGAYGYVRYLLSTVIYRSEFTKKKYKCKRAFTVNKVCDLNSHPLAKVPVSQTKSKTFCCWCCKSGPVSVNAWIPRAAYVPGEVIICNCRIENLSGKVLKGCKVQLCELSKFYAQGSSETSIRTLSSMTYGRISEPDINLQFSLTVPPTIPTGGLEPCRIINTSYYINLELQTRSLSVDLKLYLGVLIGNEPLREEMTVDQLNSQSLVTMLNIRPVINEEKNSRTEQAISVAEMLPPSYEECMFGACDISEPGEDNTKDEAAIPFKPLYITYNNPSS